MPAERLDDPIQLIPHPHDDEPIELHRVIGLNTIGYYSTCTDGSMIENYTRGVVDNQHHTHHYVLLTDVNPFDEDGNLYYEDTEEGLIGNKTGKNYGPGFVFRQDHFEADQALKEYLKDDGE
jgi:hypothetical protein